jgi:hypothetical protein
MISHRVLHIVCVQAEGWLSNHWGSLWPHRVVVSSEVYCVAPCWESANNPSLSMCLMIWLDYVLHHFTACWSQRCWTVVYWCTSVSFFEEWYDVGDDLFGCFVEQSRWDLIWTGGLVWIETAYKCLSISYHHLLHINTLVRLTSINVQEKILKNPVFKSTIFFLDVY